MHDSSSQHVGQIYYDADQNLLVCAGSWTIQTLSQLTQQWQKLSSKVFSGASIQAEDLQELDSAGSLLMTRIMHALLLKAADTRILVSDSYRDLLILVEIEQARMCGLVTEYKIPNWFYRVGFLFLTKLKTSVSNFDFFGHVICLFGKWLIKPWRAYWPSIFHNIEEVGYGALPIVALLSFLIGIVITYQIGLQLKVYGASIYAVDISGMIIFREFGPLLTAIIVAARTSTAFAAQIGTMKVNEEIDALEAMAVSSVDRLVIPKVIGTLISVPLLTVWSNIFGVLGSMLMTHTMLNIQYPSYIIRFQQMIAVKHYIVGLIKTPFFAVGIATIGCYQGFSVGHSADSVGRKTTQSAVQSIFMIIVIDAIFSVIFSMRGI